MHTREQSPRQRWMAVLARASAAELAPFESALRDWAASLPGSASAFAPELYVEGDPDG